MLKMLKNKSRMKKCSLYLGLICFGLELLFVSNALSMENMALKKQLCDKPLTLHELSQEVEMIRRKFFNHIMKHNIVLESFQSEKNYFQTKPIISSLFRNTFFKKYRLQYNPNIFSCPPSRKALTAILVHEFEHINDYYHASKQKLAYFAGKYYFSRKFKSRYERETDLKACAKGRVYIEGLIEYREWIYERLTSRELSKKKRNYFTPDELRKMLLLL